LPGDYRLQRGPQVASESTQICRNAALAMGLNVLDLAALELFRLLRRQLCTDIETSDPLRILAEAPFQPRHSCVKRREQRTGLGL
jgi:hypothetical protein